MQFNRHGSHRPKKHDEVPLGVIEAAATVPLTDSEQSATLKFVKIDSESQTGKFLAKQRKTMELQEGRKTERGL